MKMRHFLAVLSICVIIVSCVPSIHPLYTAEDIIFDPALLGTWESEDSTYTYEFITDDSLSYTMIYTEDSVPASFTVHLVLLGSQLFMDLLPDEPENANEFYKMYLIPTHAICKATLEEDRLRLDGLDMEWLEEMIEKGEVTIAHEIIEQNRILLTAPTKDLQALVMQYADDEEAFARGDELYRRE
ncbi:MAG: hypothetical protein ACREBV_00285 [Candidatus Zixiibacteriota bacterium]